MVTTGIITNRFRIFIAMDVFSIQA